MKICVYPGSFDPVTNGHLDIIERAYKICDKLIVVIGNNEVKRPAFAVEERLELLRCSLKGYKDIEIDSFSGLLIDFVKKKGANAIIKGLRAMSDFEYEFQMALLNKKLDPNIETLFMMTNIKYSFLSSSAVKELARIGGNIDGLVPDCIKERIISKLRK